MLSGPRPARRRIVRDVLLAAVGVLGVGFAVLMLVGGSGTAELTATVAGLFVALASLLLAVVDLFRRDGGRPVPADLADDLALHLREQWLEEAEARQLRSPRVLPLAWAATTREVADTLRTGQARALVVRMRLDGRLDGRFDEVTGHLAAGYARVPNRRLVVIGEPGSGKTVLAILLTLGLLQAREPGGAVPVLLPASSWDPARERLDDWIVRTVAQPYYNGRPEIPRTLLAHGLLLPVLDGLDEIPESARRPAIRRINQALGGERPVVVTCRATEYEELIRGGGPALRQAAVTEILPVSADDAIAYLRDVDWPPDVDWGPVFARLRAEPDGPVASALCTPLMVTSARLVYQRGGASPAELLDEDRFDNAYAVEEHLIHGLVDAAYAPDPAAPEGAAAPERWSPAQARRWLTFLARHLHDHRERDLAWWLISGRLLPWWAGPVTGLAAGAAMALAMIALITATADPGAEDEGNAVVGSMGIGFVYALFASLVWYGSQGRPPGRLTWSVRGSAGRLLRGFRTGAGLAAVSTVLLLTGITAARVIDAPGGAKDPRAVELYVEAVAASAALAVVVGLALAVHNWLDAPPPRAAQASPEGLLAQDRRSALVSAAAAGLVVALGVFPAWYGGVVTGDVVLRVLNDWAGWPGHPDPAMLAEHHWDAMTGEFAGTRALLGFTVLLPGLFFAPLVLLGRAWPRFVVARVWLAARGKLPWRLMAFLADARRRELLRQVGGIYQFRHIRLQETLAGEPVRTGDGEGTRRPVRRRTAVAAGAVLTVAAAGWGLSRRRDGAVAVLADPERRQVVAARFRPGGAEEVALLYEDGMLRLWSGHEGDHSATDLGGPGLDSALWYSSLAFVADGRFLVIGTSGGMQVRDLLHRSPGTGLGHPLRASGDLSGDLLIASRTRGHYLASKSGVWKASGVAEHPFILVNEGIVPDGGAGTDCVGLDFLRDGSLAAVIADGVTWRLRPPGFPAAAALLPPQRWRLDDTWFMRGSSALVASHFDDSLALFGPAGATLWTRSGTGWAAAPGELGQMRTGAFSPTRPLLAVAGLHSGDVHLWHTTAHTGPRRVRVLTGHDDAVLSLDFSARGDRLVTTSADGTVRVWDVSPH